MLIENQKVKVKWMYCNRKHYSEKGYNFTKYKDDFYVDAEDLTLNSKYHVKVKCDYCGEIHNVPFQSYIRGHKIISKDSCTHCVGKKCAEITRNKRRDKLYDELQNKSMENGYGLLSKKSDIENNRTYIKYVCPIHGVQSMRIANYLSGKKCPLCSNSHKKEICRTNRDDLINEITRFNGVLLNPDDYINNQTKNLKILCPECKDIFVTSFRSFVQHKGQVCKKCSKTSESMGERKIRHFLDNHSIDYVQEYWFSDCRDKNPLPFDFYIPSKNLIIEFDGRQHFEDTGYFSYSYDKTKEHDEIKNEYCNRKNIDLLRIPYYQIEKINDILSNKLLLT